MRRRDAGKTSDEQAIQKALQECFAPNDDLDYINFDGLEYAAFGRLVSAVTRMGGMVTLYGQRDGGGVVVSVRVGERRKSLVIEDALMWDNFLPQFADPFYVALGRYLAARKSALKAAQTDDRDDAGTPTPKAKK